MLRATILRTEYTLEETLGTLVLDGRIFCCTLELPWRQNRNDISCIPEGFYMAKRVVTEDYGATYLVLHVERRSEVLLGHVGNTRIDTLGCILLGMYPGELDGRRAVLNSARAIEKFLKATEGHEVLSLGIWSVRP